VGGNRDNDGNYCRQSNFSTAQQMPDGSFADWLKRGSSVHLPSSRSRRRATVRRIVGWPYCAAMMRLDYIAVSFAVMLTAGIVIIASLMH
jgi:hypothetical protein